MPTALALKRGRGGIIDPSSYSIGVTRLAATCDESNNVLLSVTQASGANDEDYRLQRVGTSVWSDWTDLESFQQVELETPNVNYWVQARGKNGASLGPPSNIASFITAGPKPIVKSAGTKTIQSTTSGVVADVDLTAMDAGTTFASGDFGILIGGYGHGALATSQGIAGAATGWSQRKFNGQAVSAAQFNAVIFDKVLAGTETTVDVFDDANVSTTSRRSNYIFIVLPALSGYQYVYQDSNLAASTGTPSLQTIPCGSASAPVVAIAIIYANAATAVPSFTTYDAVLPYSDVVKSSIGGTAPVAVLQARVKIFPAGTQPSNINIRPPDLGNNVFGYVYYTLEPG